MTDAGVLVQKLWNFCSVLRDDGLSYGDYVEQLTFLLYLKMDYERTQPPYNQEGVAPSGFDWSSLLDKAGMELDSHYRELLEHLGTQSGMLGVIFRKAQNRISDPAKLRRIIIDLIGSEQWLSLDADVKGDAYEGLLEKNAQDSKSGAGQYFTPRPIIKMMCEVMDPKPGMVISDPACGTGGFLLAAYNYIIANNPNMDRDQKEHLRFNALKGVELVDSVTRLCAMNLSLHGIGNDVHVPVRTADSLSSHPGEYYDMVLANPPFGTKSSVKIITAGGEIATQDLTVERDDFWTSTSNKQLMFLQHIVSILRVGGKAAVVLPDNVLFDGGAGETIRKKLMQDCDLHTILRLPTGLFYAPGVKSNILFFTKGEASADAKTSKIWIYDLRTNMSFTPKQRPLKRSDLDEFVELYCRDDFSKRADTWSPENEDGRWRSYTLDYVLGRDNSTLTMTWIKRDGLIDYDNLPEPIEIVGSIESDLKQLTTIIGSLVSNLESV